MAKIYNIDMSSFISTNDVEFKNLFRVIPTYTWELISNPENYIKYNNEYKVSYKDEYKYDIDDVFKWVNNKQRSFASGFAKHIIKMFNLINLLENTYNRNLKSDIFFKTHVEIHSKEYQKTVGNSYAHYINFLISVGLLKKLTNYSTGQIGEAFKIKYEINPILFNCENTEIKYTLVFIDDVNYNIDDVDVNKHFFDDRIINTIDERMINTLNNVRLNKVDAINAELKNYKENGNITLNKLADRISTIMRFGENIYLVKGKKVNRIYHHITNLSSIARKHFNIKFNQVDITNSQPLILAYMMAKEGIEVDNLYLENIQNGTFYESLIDKNNQIRKEIKTQVYQFIFFGFLQKNQINKNFKNLYPNVWNYLKNISDKKYENGKADKTAITLASKLQNMETEIFETTPSVCVNSNFIYTLHDCIYFDCDQDKKNVEYYLTQKFGEFGLKVQFNFD